MLETTGDTINFIDTWLKRLEDNYEMRSEIHNKAMKEMFKQIPLTIIKSLNPKKSPETYDRN